MTFTQTAWQGTSSPVQFQPVSEPFEIEIEDQSLLPSNRRTEFTLFTHAHAAIEGEVAAAGGLLTSSKGLPISDVHVIKSKGNFWFLFLLLSLFFPSPE